MSVHIRAAALALIVAVPYPVASGQGTAALPAPVLLDTTGLFQDRYARVGSDFFIGGQPTERALRELKAQGVTVVVNLRMPQEMQRVPFDEAALVKSLGMTYVHLPMRGTDEAPYAPDAVTKFAEAVRNANGKVLLHCTVAWRASHLWAAYLIKEKGVADEEALANARAINLMDDHRMTQRGTQPVEDFLGRKPKGLRTPG
ncbi:MAG: dual specificity protein phosphatase family protein [Gemmatimonadaceae bacterium]|nr:dual specificity protein phosphatase family protein [Gemmatimonadaceae bacterium]